MTIDSRFYELAAILNRGGAFAHYWIPSRDDGQKYSLWYAVNGHVPEPPASWQAQDLYYSVNPAGPNVDRSVHTKIHKSDVAAVNCLYAEFDNKDWADEDALTAHIASLRPFPSAIVQSGGGYHAYWLLSETYEINTAAGRTHIDQIETAWVGYVKGDPTVHDLARVLRVPGSQNHKYSPPKPVSLMHFVAGCVYRLADLIATLEGAGQWPPVAKMNTAAAGVQAVTSDDHELLQLIYASDSGYKFELLYQGDTTQHGGDHSKADLALCALLAFWTQKDESRMDRLFRQSGLMRPKWDRDEYRERTIDLACKSVTSVFNPAEPTDQGAIDAAMSAVDTAPPGAGTPPPQPAQAQAQPQAQPQTPLFRLADLEPEITKMLSRRMSREDKAELSSLIVTFLAGNGQLLFDTVTNQAYVQDEKHQVLGLAPEKQNAELRRYLRDAGINSTEYTYQYVIEEMTMAAMFNRTELHQNMFQVGDVLYIPCGPSYFVRASLDKGLEKLPNGTDNVYFIANSAIPEWQPVTLEDAQHPLTLKATQVAINTPPDAAQYTPDVQQVLLSAWLVAFMAGIRPLPLLATLGNKGGGKSMLLRSIMKLVMGPNQDLTTITTDKRDYDTMVTNDLLVGLDNVDQLPNGAEWFFDSLATTATGGMNKRRQYHTLAQQVNLPIVAAVMVSSRTASFARPDVAERTLPIFVRPFEDTERETDSSLLGELPQRRDAVLSWMAYHAVNVMDRRGHAPKGLPARFQDFAQIVWAYCVSTDQEDQVIPILKAWRSAQSLSVGDADPLMRAIVEYLSDNAMGTGLQDLSAKELVSTLEKAGYDLPFMGGGKGIAARLRELKTMLATLGITLTERVIQQRPRFSIELMP